MRAGAGFFIASRYLLGRNREGGRYLRGAAAGIALSLVPIIVTLIVSDGMIRGIVDRYIEMGTGHIQVAGGSGVFDGEVSRIRALEGVRAVWEERQGLGVIVKGSANAGAAIRAMDASFWRDGETARYLVTLEGSTDISGERDVLLGEALAENLGVKAGETVRIMTLKAGASGGPVPRMTLFTVKGIISSGYRELDALWCITTLEGGRRLLGGESSPPFLVVKTVDPYGDISRTGRLIHDSLGSGYRVYTWKQLIRSQYNSYESTKQLLLFIMALIVVVAVVNVSSATSMLVIEREREIAVLKAAGVSPLGVSAVFLWGGGLTGLCGGLAGCAAGLAVGREINLLIRVLERLLSFFSGFFSGEAVHILDPGFYLAEISIIIDWKSVGVICFFTVFCAVVSSAIPAGRAGKLRPLELLRKR